MSSEYEKDGSAFLIDGFEPLNSRRIFDYEMYVHLLIDSFKLSKSFLVQNQMLAFVFQHVKTDLLLSQNLYNC